MPKKIAREPANWILDEKVKATVLAVSEDRTDLLISRLHGPGAAVLSVTAEGRILTNYQDVDISDDFPAYLGLFDQFSELGEHVKPGDSVIMDDENLDVDPEGGLMGLTLQIDVLARRLAGVSDEATAAMTLRDIAHAIEYPGDVIEDASPIDPSSDKMAVPEMDRIIRSTLSLVLGQSYGDNWTQRDEDSLLIYADGRWELPITFGRQGGTWAFGGGKLVITERDDD